MVQEDTEGLPGQEREHLTKPTPCGSCIMTVFHWNIIINADLDILQATMMGQRLRLYATAPRLPST